MVGGLLLNHPHCNQHCTACNREYSAGCLLRIPLPSRRSIAPLAYSSAQRGNNVPFAPPYDLYPLRADGAPLYVGRLHNCIGYVPQHLHNKHRRGNRAACQPLACCTLCCSSLPSCHMAGHQGCSAQGDYRERHKNKSIKMCDCPACNWRHLILRHPPLRSQFLHKKRHLPRQCAIQP